MPAATIASRESLLSQLARRIGDPASLDEPYIIQDRVPQTRSRHVVVIWDAWENLDDSERSRVITDAFGAAGVQDAIRVAMGVTQEEALGMGYLPYRIITTWKQGDGDNILAAVKNAMKGGRGIQVRTGSSMQLRYPTLEHAREAYRLLSAAVPGPYWAIVKEEGADE